MENSIDSNFKINDLFFNADFESILNLVNNCDNSINLDLLKMIYLYANYLMHYPNGYSKSTEDLVRELKELNVKITSFDRDTLVKTRDAIFKTKWETIIKKIFLISLNHPEYYELSSLIYQNDDRNIKIYCACNGNYSAFIYDDDELVRRSAKIKDDFYKSFRKASDEERENIKFLAKALDFGAISLKKVELSQIVDADKLNATFISLIFTPIKINDIDYDIIYNIEDRRVLASKIYAYIKEHNDVINSDMFPKSFNDVKRVRK